MQTQSQDSFSFHFCCSSTTKAKTVSVMEKNGENSDDYVWESWEEMEDSGALEERLEKDLKSRQKMTAEEDGPAAGSQSQGRIVLQEDSSRTSYQPQLKILKRPMGSDADAGDAGKSTKQDSVAKTKSLAEREAEYAAARMRIMGSASSSYPDEGQSKQAVGQAKSSSKNDGESTQSKGKR